MITITNVKTYGWEAAFREMHNLMNSRDKSDSYSAVDCAKCGKIEREGSCKKEDRDCSGFECYEIGPNDLDLMKRLRDGDTDHHKIMHMIIVSCDITAPLYWWGEFDVCEVKIADKEFTLDDFSYEHLDIRTRKMLEDIVDALNDYRSLYINYNPDDFEVKGCPSKKDIWWQMIQLLPSSYNQKRTVMLNYEVLSNIYKSRKNYKLDEWRQFCEWLKSLPYSKIITCESE